MRYYQVNYTSTFFVAAEDANHAEDKAFDLAFEMFGKEAKYMAVIAEEISEEEAEACGFDLEYEEEN